MLPNPLHPAVVHLPIALVVLLPFFAAGALWAIRKGTKPARAWGITVALTALLLGSAWIALATGEQQEDRVERVVAEQPIESHEEAAKLFLALTAGVLVVAAAGFARGPIGTVARVAATAGSLVLLAAGWNVGRSGGELVYTHGAASAYTSATAARSGGVAPGAERAESEESDHE